MRWIPQRERPRRGAGWGSRKARVGAAACLAAFLLSLGAPAPALAYRCEDPPSRMFQKTLEECRVPDGDRGQPTRPKKRGSMSSLTVLVLAVAAVSLIPIGARGIPAGIDPYRYDDSSK